MDQRVYATREDGRIVNDLGMPSRLCKTIFMLGGMSGARLSAYILLLYAAVIIVAGEIRWHSAWLVFGKFLASAIPTWMLLGGALFVAMGVMEIKKGEDGRSPSRLFRDAMLSNWRKDYCWSFIWPPLLYVALLGLFGLFKQHLLNEVPFTLDRTFSNLDRAIFGTDPWRLSPASPRLTEFLGATYYGWYAPMMLGTLACAFVSNRPQFRSRYILAFVLTWIMIGSVLAYLLPAAGPCYWDRFVGGPNPYADLMAKLAQDVAVSSSYNPVLDAQAYLLAAYQGETVMGGGISAMPSMHVAAATLFACGAWGIHRLFGLFFAVFAGLIWWASVHLGWHYFVDGLVAVPMTLLIWWCCGRLYSESNQATSSSGHQARVAAT